MTKRLLIVLVVFATFLLFSRLVVKAENKTTTNSEILSCVKTAVEKRETAVQTAFDNFSTAIKSTLQTRKSELSTAWNISERNERRTAIQNAWNKFKKDKRTAVKNFNQTRLAAWKQFTIDRKVCKAQPTNEIPGADLSF